MEKTAEKILREMQKILLGRKRKWENKEGKRSLK